jgi:hypothetical protein
MDEWCCCHGGCGPGLRLLASCQDDHPRPLCASVGDCRVVWVGAELSVQCCTTKVFPCTKKSMRTNAGLVDEREHHALVMKYYKLGSVGAAFNTYAFGCLEEVGRLQLALQVRSVWHGLLESG